ncbi:hypothetical protein E3P92_00050 [Wallemia ichthyophaga]|uniref:FAD/NAD(P)-binding domain-containing protein n=1 Tax=Wallemia ichthyophaga TaxID=245174 RepID=A0A4T0HQM3_WALIC|nr:hypothetical protein E3P91_00050 [Wallemia ichthyophaga]TIB04778.1 hypothetical protein E3P95_00050 [Wallemia ichthyophaga]TIB06044.1 hypothetical protein E3P94_00050 [Wallemia ichthyophaga]TIB17407.1 hypothetical protein E3P90_00050 [Wallemia ichthyophaga]TIB18570.1 hypothetical protein E3P93_00050 [Wallemia ichthyophaga]
MSDVDLKNVVIIGSNSSINVIKNIHSKLPKTHRIVLIEANEYAYFPPLKQSDLIQAALRASVSPSWENQVMTSLENLFSEKSRHVVLNGYRAIQFDETTVTIDKSSKIGKTIPYDILLLATGSNYAFPCRPDTQSFTMKDHLKNMQGEIENSGKIVIVGGGSLGVEMSGEVRERYKDKEVTLVHSHGDLCGKEVGLHGEVYSQLTRKGVKVVLNERVDNIGELQFGYGEERTIRTTSGKEFRADFVFNAMGTKPNVSLVQDFDTSLISEKGLVKVNDFLQVDSPKLRNVFAMGDIVNIDELKTFVNANRHSSYIAANILSLANGNEASKKYSTGPTIMGVAVGMTGGAIRLGWFSFGAWAGSFKARSLFTDSFQSSYKQLE